MEDDVDSSSAKANVFVLPHRFQRKRLEDMKKSMKNKKISYENTLKSTVTHIVTEFECLEQVEKQITKEGLQIPEKAHIISTKWLIECLKASKIVPVLDSYKLKKLQAEKSSPSENDKTGKSSTELPEWACQRITTLDHPNKRFTDALEVLQQHAELRDLGQDYPRALAFRRASCVLKSLPFELQDPSQLKGLKDIGEHVRRVITDILEFGSSSEVEEILNSSWFQKMKLFTSIFGVGPSTAKNWIEKGWKTIEDVRQNSSHINDWRVAWGLAFHEDLTTPVLRQEADAFSNLVGKEASNILPGAIVTLAGGFRRGKSSGHDVDLLITHPTEGEEIVLLPKLLSALEKRGLIVKGLTERNSFRSDVLYDDSKLSMRGQLDHFEKWLGICKFPKTFRSASAAKTEDSDWNKQSTASTLNDVACRGDHGAVNKQDDDINEPELKKSKLSEDKLTEPQALATSTRDWLARRVDLIITPYSQYYYALVGWTGNKHFNRDARLYAQKVLSLKLTSHGLFDMKKQAPLPAASEKEVFQHLNLPYRDPTERNC